LPVLTCYRIESGKHSKQPLLPEITVLLKLPLKIQHMEIRFAALKECNGNATALLRWFLQLWHSIPSSP